MAAGTSVTQINDTMGTVGKALEVEREDDDNDEPEEDLNNGEENNNWVEAKTNKSEIADYIVAPKKEKSERNLNTALSTIWISIQIIHLFNGNYFYFK